MTNQTAITEVTVQNVDGNIFNSSIARPSVFGDKKSQRANSSIHYMEMVPAIRHAASTVPSTTVTQNPDDS